MNRKRPVHPGTTHPDRLRCHHGRCLPLPCDPEGERRVGASPARPLHRYSSGPSGLATDLMSDILAKENPPMKTHQSLSLVLLLLSGCATQENPNALTNPAALTPANVIPLAQDNVAGASVTVVMPVRSIGAGSGPEEGMVFLNSSADYRSSQNLTVAIAAAAVKEFKEKSGIAPDVQFRNQTIRVSGLVQRVRKDLFLDHQKTGELYDQTHLSVNNPTQIQIVPVLYRPLLSLGSGDDFYRPEPERSLTYRQTAAISG